jgi:hypothetical protein
MATKRKASKTKRTSTKKETVGDDGATGGGGDYGGGNGGGKGEGPEPFRESEGAVRVHQAYLEHRLGGGEPATPQAYLRAFEQFQKLPGAVRGKPAVKIPDPPADGHEGDDKPREKGKER